MNIGHSIWDTLYARHVCKCVKTTVNNAKINISLSSKYQLINLSKLTQYRLNQFRFDILNNNVGLDENFPRKNIVILKNLWTIAQYDSYSTYLFLSGKQVI